MVRVLATGLVAMVTTPPPPGAEEGSGEGASVELEFDLKKYLIKCVCLRGVCVCSYVEYAVAVAAKWQSVRHSRATAVRAARPDPGAWGSQARPQCTGRGSGSLTSVCPGSGRAGRAGRSPSRWW